MQPSHFPTYTSSIPVLLSQSLISSQVSNTYSQRTTQGTSPARFGHTMNKLLQGRKLVLYGGSFVDNAIHILDTGNVFF